MTDNISIVETSSIDDKVEVILRQTDYTNEQAREKLKEHNFDEIAAIRAYFGITEKKEAPIISVNQAIYKQLRHKLNANMRDYHIRVDKGEVKKVV